MKLSTHTLRTGLHPRLIATHERPGTFKAMYSTVANPRCFLALLVTLGSVLVAHHAFGQNWTPTGATNFWKHIATSADGTKLIATAASVGSSVSSIYASTNSGTNWTVTSAPVGLWHALASSADGTRLVAAGSDYLHVTNGNNIATLATNSRVYFSTNAGASWTKASGIPSDVSTLGSWTCAAASADGFKMAAVTTKRVYTSTNAGNTWGLRNAPQKQWTSIASSADGNRLIAVASTGGIFTSTDSGATWVQTSAPSSFWWWSVASSADGDKLVAVVQSISLTNAGGPIYVSRNGGTNWMMTSAPTNRWKSVASSADGSTLVAVATSLSASGLVGSTCISRDSGTTWTMTDALDAYWTCVASSADGNKLFVGTDSTGFFVGGGFFASQLPTTPVLSISAVGNDTEISWIIPSMDFVLQENADLSTANWTDVMTSPMVTNYQNHAITPAPPGNRFFRLKSR